MLFLVYEKHYFHNNSSNFVDEDYMRLFHTKERALDELNRRKKKYLDRMGVAYNYSEKESSENCIVLKETAIVPNENRVCEIQICFTELEVE